MEEALQHWVAGDDLDAAAALLGEHLDIAVSEDPSRRQLARWLEIFPPGVERTRIPLLVAHGYMRMLRWDTSALAAHLDEAAALPRTVEFVSDLESQRAALSYWRGDLEASLRHSRSALKAGPVSAVLPGPMPRTTMRRRSRPGDTMPRLYNAWIRPLLSYAPVARIAAH